MPGDFEPGGSRRNRYRQKERQNPRGPVRISLPLSFGVKRVAPLLCWNSPAATGSYLDMDYKLTAGESD